MSENENEKEMNFHSEMIVLQIARWSKIVSWAMLVIYLVRFVSDLISVFGPGGYQFPTLPMDIILFVASLLSTPFFGGFYFLILQGVAQGLYLGLDLFLKDETDEE